MAKGNKDVTTKNNESPKVSKKETTFENSFNFSSLLKIIWNVVFWCAFFILLVIWITDFYKVSKNDKPMFCIKTVEHEYDDGTTTECVGLGYKVYTYNRDSIKTNKQFTPFFVKMDE